ncbi:hypothetical protein GCM10028808_57050 [Spirosoma migulaei]
MINVTLETQEIRLREFSIQGKKPLVEILGDKIILNIESNPVFSGNYAFDVLSTAPRVSVDPITKTVALDGKIGLILYQNGRQLYLPADQVVSYLQSLPANAISRIEILTNPPVQYDAGSSGVILLFTKGLDKGGFTGELSLSAGVGRYPKSNGSLSLSLQAANVQGTFLYAPSYRPTYFSWESAQKLTNSATEEMGYSRSHEFNKIDILSHLFRTSWDWKIARTTAIGAVVQASQTTESDNPTSSIEYQLATASAERTQIDAITQLKQNVFNVVANVNLRKKFTKPQSSLSADFDFARYTNSSLSSATFTQYLPQNRLPETIRVRYPNRVQIRTAKVDYSTRLGKKGQFESGIKYSSISMNNLPVTEGFSAAFTQLEPLLSKPYQYQERTASAYGNINYSWSHFSLQAGLRLEHTNYQGESGQSIPIRRDYTNLFPSINFQFTAPTKNQYSLSLNRRIIRPAFDLLNPAYIFYDPLTLYSGNPLLLPQLTTTLQVSYTSPKRLNLSVVYSDSRNRIAEIVYRIDSIAATTLDYRINFDWEKRVAATLSVPIDVTPVWQILATLTSANSRFYSTFKDTPVLLGQSTAIVRLSNTIKGKIWSANVNLTYRSTAVVGYMYYDPIWFLDLGIQRSLGKRATIKLAASDLFHTMLIVNHGNYLNTNITFRHKYESQRVMLSYTHRLGSTKAKGFKERQFGSDTEQERLSGDSRN